jgi:hypothetical protein
MGYAIFYVPLFLYAMTLVFQSNFQKIRENDERLEKELHDVEADVERIIEDCPIPNQNSRKIAKK